MPLVECISCPELVLYGIRKQSISQIWTNESAPLCSWLLTYLENHVRSPVTVIVETTLELEREQSNINSKNN